MDKSIFKESLFRVVVHHDALRAKFIKTSRGWEQILEHPEKLNLSIDFMDFSDVDDEDKADKIDNFIFLNQGEMNLLDAPLIKVKVFYLGEGKGYVGRVNIHHLLVDGYSAGIFFDDWIECYSSIIMGKEFSFPKKTASTCAWINRLIDSVNSLSMQNEIDYWINLPWDKAVKFPIDHAASATENTAGSNIDLNVSLSQHHTSALLNQGMTMGVPVINILIAALVQTLAHYAQGQWIPVRVLDAGRGFDLGLDVSRTVGWLCVQRTLMLQASIRGTPIDALRSIHEQIEVMPNKGFGFELLQFYHKDKVLAENLQALVKTEIFLNFHGVTEYSTTGSHQVTPFSANLDKGKYSNHWISPLNVNNEKFTCNAGIANGKLNIAWRYSENLYDKNSVVMLTNQLLNNLIAFTTNILSDDSTDGIKVLEAESITDS